MSSVRYCISQTPNRERGPTVGRAERPRDSLGTRTNDHMTVWVQALLLTVQWLYAIT